MALNRIPLRKLLKILFLDPKERRAALLKDIATERAKARGRNSSGPDFHGPFWYDAKDHVFGKADLHIRVEERIEANARRAKLYPRLRDGFLIWWNQRRRWTNEPFQEVQSPTAEFKLAELHVSAKVDNFISVRDSVGAERFIYPYFSLEPPLSEEAARLGLWLLTQALPDIPPEEFRILDVIRGQTFSLDRTPFRGNEKEDLQHRCAGAIREREILKAESE